VSIAAARDSRRANPRLIRHGEGRSC